MTGLLTNWNPWEELEQLRADFGRLLPERWRFSNCEPNSVPGVNLKRDADRVVLTAELPGISPDELDVTVTSKNVTIHSKYPERDLGENEKWLLRERPRGEFRREIGLPFEVNPDESDAVFDNGVLTLTLHRPEEHKPKKVTIKTA